MSQNKSRIAAALLTALGFMAFTQDAAAGGEGTSGGLTLIEAAGARAAALGEAFSAAQDDVTAAAYNPAALASITVPQVSFSYQKGIADDTSGRFHFGRPNLGFAVSYYSAGDVELFDGAGTRNVNAQTDLVASLGGSIKRGAAAFGAAAKLISSELAESDKATGLAADFGVGYQFNSRFRASSALQNLGTDLKFVDEGDPLPRILRAGFEFEALQGRAPLTLRLELPYFLNESELRPALGAEVRVNALAFRAGYRSGSEIEGLTLGTGFALGALSIDYSFGFVEELDARQRLSIGFRFGGAEASPQVKGPMGVAALQEAVTAFNNDGIFNGGVR